MILNIDAKTNGEIESPDSSLWKLVSEEQVQITYTYVVDQPEETELELVAEYPNGGKDYRQKVVKEERGHFEVTKKDGELFTYPVQVPDGITRDVPVPDVVDLVYWERYTEGEIEQREQEAAELQAKAEEREAILSDLPETLAATDDAICLLYEMVLEGNNG